MSNNNNQIGCGGCLAALSLIALFWFITSQLTNYELTGKFDFSPPRIRLGLPKLGTPKNVKECADYLKNTSYANDVSIDNETISFWVNDNTIDVSKVLPYPENPSMEDIDKYWKAKSGATWGVIDRYVSSSIKRNCQAPVTISYNYLYAKRIFTGRVILQNP